MAREVVDRTVVLFDAVGGPTLGADALTIGIAGVKRCRWFFVRKEPKGRGTNQLVEGARIGMAQNMGGSGGSSIVHILEVSS